MSDSRKLFLDKLNTPQRAMAEHRDGPALTIACAGSGKTTGMIGRIVSLRIGGVDPSRICAITFTKKAAREMQHRLRGIDPLWGDVFIKTFHGACATLLFEHRAELGIHIEQAIFSGTDSALTVKRAIDLLEMKDDGLNYEAIAGKISKIKSYGLRGTDSHEALKEHLSTREIEIAKKYDELLASSHAWDFGDLLLVMLENLKANDDFRAMFQSKFDYVLVDEFQDTNGPQMELLKTLREKNKNILAVGDDDQSIYGWRGAVPAYIINFEKEFGASQIYHLTNNYRCSGNIVKMAASVVEKNKERLPKDLTTTNQDGCKVELRVDIDDDHEAAWVAQKIQTELGEFPYGSIAILVRKRFIAESLIVGLAAAGIPYVYENGIRFFEKAEVMLAMAMIQAIYSPEHAPSFDRIARLGIGMNAVKVKKIMDDADGAGIGVWCYVRKILAEGGRINKHLDAWVKASAVIQEECRLNVAGVLDSIMKHFPLEDLIEAKLRTNTWARMKNIEKLSSMLKAYVTEHPGCSIHEWLHAVAMSEVIEDDDKVVKIMTIHSAKGMEFDRVYLCGVEQGILPDNRSLSVEAKLDEERRVFYVGATRAKKKLSLTRAKVRYSRARPFRNEPSEFLSDIPAELIETDEDVVKLVDFF
jgi:DNA helicase-2/ATP-dependent DNA helicase PcrA